MDTTTIAPFSSSLGLHAPPPLVVLALGAAVANALDPRAFAPDCVSLDDNGCVVVPRAPAAHRWRSPERRGPNGATIAEDDASAALWTLGRFLLELSLGDRLDTAVVDDLDADTIAVLVDVDGRVLPRHLVDVLAALLAPDPAHRLQSTRAAVRVCTDAAGRFGDVDTALRVAARQRPQRVTADLPARDILSSVQLQNLKRQTQVAGLDDRAAALFDVAALPDCEPLAPVTLIRDVVARTLDVPRAAIDNDNDNDNNDEDNDLAHLQAARRRQWWAAAAIGGGAVMLVLLAFALT